MAGALGRFGPALRNAIAYIQAHPKDPKVLLGLGGGALAVVSLLVAVAATTGPRSRSPAESPRELLPKSQTSDSVAQTGVGTAASASPGTPTPAPACRLMGESLRLASKASKDVPLEIAVMPGGDRVRLGFSTATNVAQGLSIERPSLRVSPEFALSSKDKLRAVVPIAVEGSPHFVVHADRQTDKLKAWRTLSVDPPSVVGWSGDALSIAAKSSETPKALWSLDGEGAPDAIRVVGLGERGHAVVFRRNGEILGGLIGHDRSPVGELTKIAGAGAPPQSPVGSPTVAMNGQSIGVAFADRASSAEPWGIRIGSAPVGSLPAETSAFAVPSGGPGGAALAPALSGLPDGRWLLVWTEGGGGAHDVRAVTLDSRLSQVGAPFAVSHPGSNAGQGAVVLHDGYGLVAYLALTEDGYEVWGASVDCR